jgi:hypothetical protein
VFLGAKGFSLLLICFFAIILRHLSQEGVNYKTLNEPKYGLVKPTSEPETPRIFSVTATLNPALKLLKQSKKLLF